MEKSEITVKMAKIGLIDNDCIEFHNFAKLDRFNNGRIALAQWHWYGTQCIKAKQAFKRNAWLDILSAILKIDKDLVNVSDRAACIKLADLELKELKAWYDAENKFCVSPRTILAQFTKKDKKDKSELEKILATIELLTKQIDSYKVTKKQAAQIDTDIANLPKMTKPVKPVKTEKSEK